MIENIIPIPWKILPQLVGAKLHCELSDIEINLEKIRSEYYNILQKKNFKIILVVHMKVVGEL